MGCGFPFLVAVGYFLSPVPHLVSVQYRLLNLYRGTIRLPQSSKSRRLTRLRSQPEPLELLPSKCGRSIEKTEPNTECRISEFPHQPAHYTIIARSEYHQCSPTCPRAQFASIGSWSVKNIRPLLLAAQPTAQHSTASHPTQLQMQMQMQSSS